MYRLFYNLLFLFVLLSPVVHAQSGYDRVDHAAITSQLSQQAHTIQSFFNSNNQLLIFTISLPNNQYSKTLTVYVHKKYVRLEHPSFYFGEYEFSLFNPTSQDVVDGIQEAIKTIK